MHQQQSKAQDGLKHRMKIQGRKMKPVIQQGAYIESHVKKNSNTHHPLSLTVSQRFLSHRPLQAATARETLWRIEKQYLNSSLKGTDQLFGLCIYLFLSPLLQLSLVCINHVTPCVAGSKCACVPALLSTQSPFQQQLNSHRSRGHYEQPYHVPTPLNHGNHITWPPPMTNTHRRARPSGNLTWAAFKLFVQTHTGRG